MTPGVALTNKKDNDQTYRSIDSIDTDYLIIGRALYLSNSDENIFSILNKITC